jgi:hypothetical protein
MTSEAVMTGLGSSYKITKMADLNWLLQRGDAFGEISFKDGIVTWAGEYIPVGTGDAASFVQELFKAFYPHARPATDEVSKRSGLRNDNVQIWMAQYPGDMQKISFTLSDGAVYSILVAKAEKSDKPNVILKKEWQ